MYGDENCKCYEHHDCDCHCHDGCACNHEEYYNGYSEGDIVGEADFQIVDQNELDEMKNQGNIGGNLGDDLVNLGFIDKDDPLYEEMKNEGRDGVMYDIDNE